MNKYTPGPWVVCIQDDGDRAFTVFAESQVIGGRISASEWDRCIATTGLDHEEFEANARLIAAAPELLDAARLALKEAEGLIHDEYDGTTMLNGLLARLEPVRVAIAKAMGGQQ